MSSPDGTQTEFGGVQSRSSLFERPGHPELWMWTDRRRSAVPLRSDELVYNTFKHSLGRLSLATDKLQDL